MGGAGAKEWAAAYALFPRDLEMPDEGLAILADARPETSRGAVTD